MEQIRSLIFAAVFMVPWLACPESGIGQPHFFQSRASLMHSARKMRPRIFGGTKLQTTGSVGLLLAVEPRTGKATICSGAFLSSRNFLTAKHCFTQNGLNRPSYVILPRKGARGIKVKSKRKSAELDLAVASFTNAQVTSAPIRVSRTPFLGESVAIYGYGLDEFQKTALSPGTSHYLKGGIAILGLHTPNLLAFTNTFQGGACQGDSGGPMFALNNSGDPGIIGVASFSRSRSKKCSDQSASYYVNVSEGAGLSFIAKAAPDTRIN